MITHWDDVEADHRERGHIAAAWQALTGANSVTAGVRRIAIDPGRWATPLHLEGSEEEIFYVLSGTGVSVQWDGGREEAFAVGPGDCLVHLALEHAHTIGAGDAFGAAFLAWLHDHVALGPTLSLEADELRSALEFACLAGAITCTRAGAEPPWMSEMTARD